MVIFLKDEFCQIVDCTMSKCTRFYWFHIFVSISLLLLWNPKSWIPRSIASQSVSISWYCFLSQRRRWHREGSVCLVPTWALTPSPPGSSRAEDTCHLLSNSATLWSSVYSMIPGCTANASDDARKIIEIFCLEETWVVLLKSGYNCCVGFCYRTKWISHIYVHVSLP